MTTAWKLVSQSYPFFWYWNMLKDTSRKFNMELKHHPFEKENYIWTIHLHFWGSKCYSKFEGAISNGNWSKLADTLGCSHWLELVTWYIPSTSANRISFPNLEAKRRAQGGKSPNRMAWFWSRNSLRCSHQTTENWSYKIESKYPFCVYPHLISSHFGFFGGPYVWLLVGEVYIIIHPRYANHERNMIMATLFIPFTLQHFWRPVPFGATSFSHHKTIQPNMIYRTTWDV